MSDLELLPQVVNEDDVLMDIDTKAKITKYIRIDGNLLPILNPYHFGLNGHGKLSRLGKNIETLMESGENSAVGPAVKSLNTFVLMVLPNIPSVTFDALTDHHKLGIMRNFLKVLEKVEVEKSDKKPETTTELQQAVAETEAQIAELRELLPSPQAPYLNPVG